MRLAAMLFRATRGREAGKHIEAQEIRRHAELELAKSRQARGEAEEAMARAERQRRFVRERYADADEEREEYLEHGRG